QIDLFDRVSAVDIDGDKDLDIHIKGYSYNEGTRDLIYENVGVPTSFSPSIPTNLTSSIERNVSLSWNSTPGLQYNIEVKRNGDIYKPSDTSPSGRLLMMDGILLRRDGTLILRS